MVFFCLKFNELSTKKLINNSYRAVILNFSFLLAQKTFCAEKERPRELLRALKYTIEKTPRY